jgi:hypothetical protein
MLIQAAGAGGNLTRVGLSGVHPVNASCCPFPDTQVKNLLTTHKIATVREGIKK